METQKNIDRLLDVEMNVTVRFGKTELPLREVVGFGVGSMLELNRTVDEPVELLVNNFPFARGEVVVVDGYYGVRVTEIGLADERSNSLFPLPIGVMDAKTEDTVAEARPVAYELDDAAVADTVAETSQAEPSVDEAEESEEIETTEETSEEQS